MGRPRGFDEQEVTAAAAALFAERAYDGLSIDDLVGHLGVHRNSLYKTFGSKRGLYLAALRWYLEHELAPLMVQLVATADPLRAITQAGTGWDLLLLAAAERAPVDPEVAALVGDVLTRLDQSWPPGQSAAELSALLLGARLRARALEQLSPP